MKTQGNKQHCCLLEGSGSNLPNNVEALDVFLFKEFPSKDLGECTILKIKEGIKFFLHISKATRIGVPFARLFCGITFGLSSGHCVKMMKHRRLH